MAEKEIPVSPVNGQPVPRGKPFTSESAREARRKRTEKEQNERSITDAFKKRMSEKFVDPKTGKVRTGAELIADSIIKGASNNNAKMVEIALAIMGETPTVKVAVSNGQLAELIDGLREPFDYDIHAETTRADGAMED